MKICRSCYQDKTLCEDGKLCIPVSHPSLSFTVKTNTPYSVVLKVLQDANIKIEDSCHVIFDTVEYKDDYPVSELSFTSQEEEQEQELIYFLNRVLNDNIQYDLKPKQTKATYIKSMILEKLNDIPENRLKETFQLIEKVGVIIYPKASTRDVFYTCVRTELKKKYPLKSDIYNLCLDNMKIERHERKDLINKYTEQVKEKNEKQLEFKQLDILNKIEYLKTSEDIFDKITLGLIISGCRPCELMIKNNFEVHSDTEVKITNLAKKRGAKVDDYCIRPIINIAPEDFIKLVTEIRDDKEETTNFRKKLARITNKHFNVSPSFLRKIYGNLAYLLFSPDTVNVNVFLSKVLGHDVNDLSTSFSYSIVKIR